MKTSLSLPSAVELRTCLIEATPEDAQAAENAAELPAGSLYIPPSHLKALSPDKPLVVGMRGAGKSYWWRQLQETKLLPLIYGDRYGAIECKPGYGKGTNPADCPDRKVLTDLIGAYEPEDIWRAVIGRHVPEINDAIPSNESDWRSRIIWMKAHVEIVQNALYRFDKKLQAGNQRLMILFDALDDAADTWKDRKHLLRGLFRVLVDLRTYRALRGKVFIRPDMLTPDVIDFPDASKLQSEKVDLDWPRSDLYALLWQGLANDKTHGETFRSWSAATYSLRWEESRGIWQLPGELKKDDDVQRRVFHGLAGEWMGKDSRRGFPYTWLPNHLGDANAKVSPRSFLVAVHKAAEVTAEKYPNTEHSLHYEAIKTGVQQASIVRVSELQVEYPWVHTVMTQLKGRINLPCEWSDIMTIWDEQHLIDKLADVAPLQPSDGLDKVRDLLRDIAIFEDAKDGIRINVPDVFRIGYGLGRRGGVKPVR